MEKIKGAFIVIEGCEGAGKGKHASLLLQYLKEKDYNPVLVREPGGTELGEFIRNLLILNPNIHLSPYAEMFLFNVCRAQLCYEKIIPELEKGSIVIADRYYHSTIVYQGNVKGIDIGLIDAINKHFPKPDLVFILDVENVEEALQKARRISKKSDRYEKEDLSFHTKIRDSYRLLAYNQNNLKENIVLIKRGTIEETQKQIRDHVDIFLSKSRWEH